MSQTQGSEQGVYSKQKLGKHKGGSEGLEQIDSHMFPLHVSLFFRQRRRTFSHRASVYIHIQT